MVVVVLDVSITPGRESMEPVILQRCAVRQEISLSPCGCHLVLYTAEQPAVPVKVNATWLVDGFDNYADPDNGLTIKAHGGFMFGETPLDDWCCGDTAILQPSTDDGTGWPNATVVPRVMTVSKSYNGPSNKEDETATGPNYPRSYTLLVDIANGETISNLTVTDDLPETVQFISVVSSEPYNVGASTLPSTATPGGNLVLFYIFGQHGCDHHCEFLRATFGFF